MQYAWRVMMTPWLISILTGQFLLVNEEDTKRIGKKLSMIIVNCKKSIFLPQQKILARVNIRAGFSRPPCKFP